MSTAVSVTAPGGLRAAPLFFLAAGLTLFGGAFFLEHGMGIEPCILCVYQRIAPALVVALAAIAALPRVPGLWARRLTLAIAGVFLAGAVLAGYHVGVEQHWWAGTPQCGGQTGAAPPLSASLGDLRAALAAPEIVPCDAVPWSLFGISLAGFNLILSLGLAVAAAWAARRAVPWRER